MTYGISRSMAADGNKRKITFPERNVIFLEFFET
jgi:hypothetical protein